MSFFVILGRFNIAIRLRDNLISNAMIVFKNSGLLLDNRERGCFKPQPSKEYYDGMIS